MKYIGKLLIALWAVISLSVIAPDVNVMAAESGSCGDSAAYTLDSDGVLRITGTGSIKELSFYENAEIKSVVIGDGITSIENGAFRQCSSIEAVNIPDSVTFISSYAFYGCSSLKSIKIPKDVTII